MLDAIDDRTEDDPALIKRWDELLAAFAKRDERLADPTLAKWRHRLPYPAWIAEGDDHLTRAREYYAAGGLSDAQISDRQVDAYTIVLRPDTAAIVLARHLAWCGWRAREITLALADLAGLLPGWPQDPEHLTWIADEADRAENGDG